MYSGSTLTIMSGRILGAHQKIDRVARRHLERLAPLSDFPAIGSILHFEGSNGPDAIKRKSPGRDEPWHYFQPFNETDVALPGIIKDRYELLVDALRRQDDVRAAFEAAWLSHAAVDGLTPAHHYQYTEKLSELRLGQGLETRNTVGRKIILPGTSLRNQVSNNWKMWGPKGLFTTHSAFEWGVATLIAPITIKRAMPRDYHVKEFNKVGPVQWFCLTAKEIAALGIYDSFYKFGWTPKLARQVRRQLAPSIVRTVTLLWYSALCEAREKGSLKK